MSPNRREFLKLALVSSSLAFGCTPSGSKQSIPGKLLGNNSKTGHLLRDGKLPASSRTEQAEVVIIGGGISGLVAGKELLRAGVSNFTILELDQTAGGNSSSGKNYISGYPWGAHYVPVPNQESEHVISLFRELDLISGDKDGRPHYRDEALCHEPEERLFIHGKWQSSLLPEIGTSEAEKQQAREFLSYVETMKHAVGKDGKPAFAIPLDLSSRDEEFLALDAMSFAAFLDSRGWTAKPLRWYTNYCCRDDYGTTEADTSAWAGLHYFAGRRPFAANTSSYELLTWPEGNGWLVNKLMESLGGMVRLNSLVHRISEAGDKVEVGVFDTAKNESYTLRADYAVFAAPRFTFPYLFPEIRKSSPQFLKELSYSPWMVANITIENYPHVTTFAWDNVSYHSRSLGYVVATHQQLSRQLPRTVITWYLPLSSGAPKDEREKALATPLHEWQSIVVDDLRRMHPDIERSITNIDVRLWGHAMPRPVPGFFKSAARRMMQEPFGRIHFAHSDMSGISIFEEAQYRGVLAGREVARLLREKT